MNGTRQARRARTDKENLAARLGGWSARHRKTAIIGWLLFVVVASVVGGMAGQKTMEPWENGVGDSCRPRWCRRTGGTPWSGST